MLHLDFRSSEGRLDLSVLLQRLQLNLFTSFLTQVDVCRVECSSQFLYRSLEGHRFVESLCPSFFRVKSHDFDGDFSIRYDPGVEGRLEIPNREAKYQSYLNWAASRKFSFNRFVLRPNKIMFLRKPETIYELVQVIVKCVNVDPIHLANDRMTTAFYDALTETSLPAETTGIQILSIYGIVGNKEHIKICDGRMKIISASFPQLQKLTLGRPCNFSDYGLRHLGALKGLNELCLVFGLHIKDEGVRYVAENCLQLEIVRLIRCRRLTNRSLEAFCKHKLKHFELSDNFQISEDGIREFMKSDCGKVVQVLDFSTSIPLSQNCIECLFDTCSCLEILHYDEEYETMEFERHVRKRLKMRTPEQKLVFEKTMYQEKCYTQFNTNHFNYVPFDRNIR
jgi:predicted RNA-binding Zn-ribbon protein involved in translation (DUF1610 family)